MINCFGFISINKLEIKRFNAISRRLTPIILVLTVLISSVDVAMSQIVATNTIFSTPTSYSSGAQDQIYFYKQGIAIDLQAISINGAGNHFFTWYRYNSSVNSWDFIQTDLGSTSTLNNAIEGGYQVVVNHQNGGSNTYRSWVFVPEITGSIIPNLVENNCYQLKVHASGSILKPLTYYHPTTGEAYAVNYLLSYVWNSTQPAKTQTSLVNPATLDGFYNDSEYSVVVKSGLGVESNESSPLLITAVAVKANFEWESTKPEVKNEANTIPKGSAPLRISFKGEVDGTDKRSQGHVTDYSWKFGETGKEYTASTIFTFQEQGDYPVSLEVENSISMCSDISDVITFNVSDSFIDAPNYFTPNGDGIQDEFRVAYRSLKTFRLVIVNRWGRKVFETSDPAKGWDGNIGGAKAAPGVYFYDAVGQGFLNTDAEKHHKHGFLHLIRDSK